jgi:hypothetical protein
MTTSRMARTAAGGLVALALGHCEPSGKLHRRVDRGFGRRPALRRGDRRRRDRPVVAGNWRLNSNQQTVASASGGTSYTHPVVAWTGPSSAGSGSYDVVTATSKNGTLDYWWKLDGGSTWHQQTVATG